MKINRQIFQDILDKAILCVAKEGLFSNAFLFENETINAYNVETAIKISLPFSFYKEKFAVKAIDLYKLIKKIPDEEVDIILEENELVIKTNNIEASLQLLEDDFSEEMKELNIEEWVDLPENFLPGLELSIMPKNIHFYSGICGENGKLYSVDGQKCSIYNTGKDIGYFWISVEDVKKILKIFSGSIQCHNGKAWITFRQNNITFSCKKKIGIEHEFKTKPCENIFKKYGQWDSDIYGSFPDDFQKIIERASLFVKRKEALFLKFNNDSIECKTENQIGNYNEKIEWKHEIKKEFDPFECIIKVDHILYALKRTNQFYLKYPEDINEIKDYKDQKSTTGKRIIFVSDNYKLIIACYEEI